MKNYKDYIISKGGKEIGILLGDIERELLSPSEYLRFIKWMGGQTMSLLSDHYNSMSIVYTGDYERFIKGLQNNL